MLIFEFKFSLNSKKKLDDNELEDALHPQLHYLEISGYSKNTCRSLWNRYHKKVLKKCWIYFHSELAEIYFLGKQNW